MALIATYIWILGFRFLELFRQDYKVWPCWGRRVTVDGLQGFRTSHSSQLHLCFWVVFQDVSSQHLLQNHTCLMLPCAIMVTDSNFLKLWVPPNAFFFIVMAFYQSNRKITDTSAYIRFSPTKCVARREGLSKHCCVLSRVFTPFILWDGGSTGMAKSFATACDHSTQQETPSNWTDSAAVCRLSKELFLRRVVKEDLQGQTGKVIQYLFIWEKKVKII